ncbi:MAG TPA: pirin family protein [Bryobacteraceae bacterium]|nr:pirin family protein [Bryobacteraceae bacterium]
MTREDAIVHVAPLEYRWQTHDPFLFCVHHVDHYPKGNERLGPAASLAGRDIGQDFEGRDGWRMYHGDVVPGFPQHPHRGFETVTIVRRGYIDHSDSLGATARFGMGDVQWLTAGAGVVHSEMFPLLNQDGPNPLELFQIWLNLPAKNKMAQPYFTMFWDGDIPRRRFNGSPGRQVEVTVIAGALGGLQPLPPPPHSWAAENSSELAIWSIAMQAGSSWTLPPAQSHSAVRTLHLFAGPGLRVAGRDVPGPSAIQIRPGLPVPIEASLGPVEILLLQARPIGEPVVQYGPFVMNTRSELEQAFADYRRTQFGGWPWPDNAPVHPRTESRFARHADGRIERPA